MIDLTPYHLSRLILYCGLSGVKDIVFKHNMEDEYDTETKTIRINKSRSLKSQLYILLHEYGHHHIVENKRLNDKFSSIIERDPKNMLSEQILAIEEEVLAWHFGEEIAEILGIDLSDKKYQVLKAKCLKSHIRSYTKIVDNQEEE
jgi:hypothetical protein